MEGKGAKAARERREREQRNMIAAIVFKLKTLSSLDLDRCLIDGASLERLQLH